jgi:hypothetical protein
VITKPKLKMAMAMMADRDNAAHDVAAQLGTSLSSTLYATSTRVGSRASGPRNCSPNDQLNWQRLRRRRPLTSAVDRPLTSTSKTDSGDPKGPLFRTIARGRGGLTATPLPQANAYAMIGRRAAAAGIATKIGNHTFRATGITAYLKNGGALETAAAMANHASTRTTQLYDRRADQVSLDEIERVRI